MSTLYIDRKGSELSITSGVLNVSTPDGHGDRKLPLKYLDRVVLRSDTALSSNVLCALAEAGVNLLVLAGRGGQKIAQIYGAPHNDARRRWQQILALSDPSICNLIARGIVHAKVRRQNEVLKKIANHRLDLRKPLTDGQHRLEGILQSLKSSNDYSLDQMRGLEGAAAALYFEAYFKAFAPALGATGRNRRPPKDPVNAVLSLSYTMLYAQASTACWSAGLDPALGALHTISHGRAALACDLMEPYRPAVDLWVWEQFRQRTLRLEHFGHDGSGACLLGKAGRGYFYPAWEFVARRRQQSLIRYARSVSDFVISQSKADTWAHLSEPVFE